MFVVLLLYTTNELTPKNVCHCANYVYKKAKLMKKSYHKTLKNPNIKPIIKFQRETFLTSLTDLIIEDANDIQFRPIYSDMGTLSFVHKTSNSNTTNYQNKNSNAYPQSSGTNLTSYQSHLGPQVQQPGLGFQPRPAFHRWMSHVMTNPPPIILGQNPYPDPQYQLELT